MDPLTNMLQALHKVTDNLDARFLLIRSLGSLFNDMVWNHSRLDMFVQKETHLC